MLKSLIAAALLLSIPAEIIVLYTKWIETRTLVATAQNAADQQKGEAEKLHAEALNAIEAAKNASERQAAEAKIAEQKAETEHQAAVNAERRAQADADKTEAQARTAKQTALNAVLRSKAEAMKTVAAANDLQSKARTFFSGLKCPSNFSMEDCVKALEYASENGHWRDFKYVAKPPR